MINQSANTYLTRVSIQIILAIAIIAALYAFKAFFVPLLIAIFIWFIIFYISTKLQYIQIKNKSIPKSLAYPLALVLISLVIYLISLIISSNINNILKALPVYQANLNKIGVILNKKFNMNLVHIISQKLAGINLQTFATKIINAVVGVLSNSFLIILYVVFLTIETANILPKIKKAVKDKRKLYNTITVLNDIKNGIGDYIWLKTLVSLLTGVVSFIALKILGVDYAAFWSLLIFLLNFIPNIGAVIAIIFPAFMALLQYVDIAKFLWVLGILIVIKVVIGDYLEPKWFGKKLNMNGFVVIVSLTIFGMLWGIVGMILSIPITLAIIVILDQFPKTQKVALFLKA